MKNTQTSILAIAVFVCTLGFSLTVGAKAKYSKQYLKDAAYVTEQMQASPDGLFDLSDDRQYRYLLETLRISDSDCVENPQVLRDIAMLRANHQRFGGPGRAVPKNDDNPRWGD